MTYQWQRGGDATSPARSGATYTLTQADVGAAITVVASYTDGAGHGRERDLGRDRCGGNVNDAPDARNDIFYTVEDAAPITVNVLANDLDADGDTLTITSELFPRQMECLC